MKDLLRKHENRLFLSKVVGYLIPISQFIGQERMVPCPFHLDSRPSAKVYSDDQDGIERLFCYGCRKNFTSYHYIKDVLAKDPYKVLFDSFSETAIRVAYEAVKEEVVLKDSSEHHSLLEGDDPILDRIEQFLTKAYRLDE